MSGWVCSDRNRVYPTLTNFLNAAESLDSLKLQQPGIMRILTHQLQRNSSAGRGPSAKTVCKGDQVYPNTTDEVPGHCQRIDRIHASRATSLQKTMLHVMWSSDNRHHDDHTAQSQSNVSNRKNMEKLPGSADFRLDGLKSQRPSSKIFQDFVESRALLKSCLNRRLWGNTVPQAPDAGQGKTGFSAAVILKRCSWIVCEAGRDYCQIFNFSHKKKLWFPRMHILLVNDDGIHAPGLNSLHAELVKFAQVTVVAPAVEQSGVGHSITYLHPLLAHREYRQDEFFGWKVEGSPADCVKLGIMELAQPRPDLVVSGINHGANVGINILYSGTVAAAIEGAFFSE